MNDFQSMLLMLLMFENLHSSLWNVNFSLCLRSVVHNYTPLLK
jgi:hypothetical protein